MQVGNRVRKVRKLQGMTGAELCRASGLSRGFLGDIEKGRTNPSLTSVERLAAALNVSAQDLLATEEGPPKVAFRAGDLQVHLRGPDAQKLTAEDRKQIRYFVEFVLHRRTKDE